MHDFQRARLLHDTERERRTRRKRVRTMRISTSCWSSTGRRLGVSATGCSHGIHSARAIPRLTPPTACYDENKQTLMLVPGPSFSQMWRRIRGMSRPRPAAGKGRKRAREAGQLQAVPSAAELTMFEVRALRCVACGAVLCKRFPLHHSLSILPFLAGELSAGQRHSRESDLGDAAISLVLLGAGVRVLVFFVQLCAQTHLVPPFARASRRAPPGDVRPEHAAPLAQRRERRRGRRQETRRRRR